MPKQVLFVVFVIILLGCGGNSMRNELTNHDYYRPAYQNPNSHSYRRSFVHRWENTMHIGGDVEPKEKLRNIETHDDFTISMGASRDGVGKNRLENYKRDLSSEFYPFRVKPKVWVNSRYNELLSSDDPAEIKLIDAVHDSISILNDALPPEFQIEFADENDDPNAPEGILLIKFMSPEDIERKCSGGSACSGAGISYVGKYTRWASISIPDNLDVLLKTQTTRTVIIHELLHALGIRRHVDSIEFPDSIIGKHGDFYPNPGFTLHRIDREALQIMYMSQRTDDYNDWGEWTDTTLHLVGRSENEHVHFGVALFNGLPQPWTRGTAPDRPLKMNTSLSGTVTWKGPFLAFSGVSPLKGDTELTVQMGNLDAEQDLRFKDIYFLNRYEEHGAKRWFPTRNIDYKVTLHSQGFYHSSEDGHVTGLFLGPEHEGMAGTLKRTNLVGAFGGTR